MSRSGKRVQRRTAGATASSGGGEDSDAETDEIDGWGESADAADADAGGPNDAAGKRRHRYTRSRWNSLREEDWVTSWWRQQHQALLDAEAKLSGEKQAHEALRSIQKPTDAAEAEKLSGRIIAATASITKLEQEVAGKRWVLPFLDIVEEVQLVCFNAAMVERMWSVFGAQFKSCQGSTGPDEREHAAKARFNVMYNHARFHAAHMA